MENSIKYIEGNEPTQSHAMAIRTYSLIIFPQPLPFKDRMEPVFAVFGNTCSISLRVQTRAFKSGSERNNGYGEENLKSVTFLKSTM